MSGKMRQTASLPALAFSMRTQKFSYDSIAFEGNFCRKGMRDIAPHYVCNRPNAHYKNLEYLKRMLESL